MPVAELLEAAAKGRAGIDQRFIHAIVDRGDAALPDLLAFVKADHSSDPVNLEEDLIAIFRHLKSDQALPFYIQVIRDNADDVSDELVDAIVPFGPRALEPLLALYDELGEEQGGDVAFLLSALGVHDPRILKILTDRLEYDAGDAALALSVYRDPAARPALEKILAEVPEDDAELRREIQTAIDAGSEPKLEPMVEPEPFDLWELFPEKATPPVEVLSEGDLLEMLGSASPEYRSEAAVSFRNRSDYSTSVRDRLLEIARQDPVPAVRGRAWEALGEKAGEPGVLEALRKTAFDAGRDTAERLGALVGLAGASDDKKIAQLMREFYREPETRARALEAMWRSFDKQFAPLFPKHLSDADEDVRRAAIWGTGYLGGEKDAKLLAAMFEDEDFRADALFAYSLLVPGKIAHSTIAGLFRKINDAAGGLTYGEAELVQTALDQRLIMHGLDPYFSNEEPETGDWLEEEEAPAGPQPVVASPKPGRNDLCPCGSGKKYKKCHGG